MVEIQDDADGLFCYIKQIDNGFIIQKENGIIVIEQKNLNSDEDKIKTMDKLLTHVKNLFEDKPQQTNEITILKR